MKRENEWYIVRGRSKKLAVVPLSLLDGREIVDRIFVSGVVDAVRKLKAFEKWVMQWQNIQTS